MLRDAGSPLRHDREVACMPLPRDPHIDCRDNARRVEEHGCCKIEFRPAVNDRPGDRGRGGTCSIP